MNVSGDSSTVEHQLGSWLNKVGPQDLSDSCPANHRHTVKVLKPGTWTFLITGPVTRRWGFWVNGKMQKRDRYFAVYGHHPCSDGQEPVRLRPDGSKI